MVGGTSRSSSVHPAQWPQSRQPQQKHNRGRKWSSPNSAGLPPLLLRLRLPLLAAPLALTQNSHHAPSFLQTAVISASMHLMGRMIHLEPSWIGWDGGSIDREAIAITKMMMEQKRAFEGGAIFHWFFGIRLGIDFISSSNLMKCPSRGLCPAHFFIESGKSLQLACAQQ